MLFYHGRKHRDYRLAPLPLRARLHWELAAILSGHAAPMMANGPHPDDRPALWIFPPGHLHGWTSHRPGGCRVCIIHVAACPHLVAGPVEAAGLLRVPLTAQDVRAIDRADHAAVALLARIPGAGEIAADLLRGHMSAIAAASLPTATRASHDHGHLVKRALAWLDAHLHESVTLADAAHATGTSPATLRRHTLRVSGCSPRDLLTDLRLNRACDLLRGTHDSLERIAWACGFASAVALSNAFLRHHGLRPGRWRQQVKGATGIFEN